MISCGSPLLQPALVSQHFDPARDHPAVVPRVDGRLVPTTAVYAWSLLPAAEAPLARGELRPQGLVDEPGIRVANEDDLRVSDPELLSFRDCDTPADYRSLLALAGLDPSVSSMLEVK